MPRPYGRPILGPPSPFRYPRWSHLWFRLDQENVWVYYRNENDRRDYLVGSVGRALWAVWSWQEREEFGMSYLRKPEVAPVASDGAVGPISAAFAGQYPALTEYMTATRTPDGRERQVSTVMLVVDPDGCKACLNERHTGHQLWVTCGSVEEAFGALEAALVAPRPNWRVSKWQPGKSRGKS